MFTRKLGSAIGHSQGVGGSFIAYDSDTRAGCGGRCSDDGRRPLLPSLSRDSVCEFVCASTRSVAQHVVCASEQQQKLVAMCASETTDMK